MRLPCQLLLKRSMLFLLLLTLILKGESAFAQNTKRVFSGKVVNARGEPIAGATVMVKGNTDGTTTDASGAFFIEATEGAVIVISNVGFAAQESTLRGNDAISITMNQTVGGLDEVVVVGYGTQRRRDLTGSIASVNVAETKKYSTSDITQVLQGRAAGVAVNSDGQPGSVPSVRIRGFSTFGNAQPFYVVDGVPVTGSIRDFSPNDVESIQVLKDAAAAAIYGSEAANGVIIITTKQGRKNTQMRVEYNGYYGIDKVWQITDVTNRAEYQMLNNEARTNGNQPLFPFNDPSSPTYITNIDTDWQKEGLKNGSRQNHNINLSGGGVNNTYNFSLDYFDNKGTYVGNGPDYKRYTARLNSTAEKGIFKIGQSFSYTHSRENSLTFRDDILLGGIPPLINSLVLAIPTMPVYDPANLGGFGGSNSEFHGENSLNGIGVNHLFTNYVDVDRMFGNVYGELQLLKNNGHNLRYKLNLGYDKTNVRANSFAPEFSMGKFFSNTIARLNDISRQFSNGVIENTVNYDKTFGKHVVAAVVGQSYRDNKVVVIEGIAQGFTRPYIPVLQSGATRSSTSNELRNTLFSYFGRVNYSFDDRYLMSASLRRDGSSRFSPFDKYGDFPAVSVGWRISNEKFWNVPEAIVSSVKFRASYGKLGNQNIGDYAFQAVINPGVVYTFDGIRVVGATQTSVVAEKLRWEGKSTINVGFDASLLNNRLDLSAEYYNAKSSDVLVGVPIPLSVGSLNAAPTINAATLKNTGKIGRAHV